MDQMKNDSSAPHPRILSDFLIWRAVTSIDWCGIYRHHMQVDIASGLLGPFFAHEARSSLTCKLRVSEPVLVVQLAFKV